MVTKIIQSVVILVLGIMMSSCASLESKLTGSERDRYPMEIAWTSVDESNDSQLHTDNKDENLSESPSKAVKNMDIDVANSSVEGMVSSTVIGSTYFGDAHVSESPVINRDINIGTLSVSGEETANSMMDIDLRGYNGDRLQYDGTMIIDRVDVSSGANSVIGGIHNSH